MKTALLVTVTGSERVPAYHLCGLAIHKNLGDWKGAVRGTSWEVSHLNTGLRIACLFPTRKEAREFAQEIAPLADWANDIHDRADFLLKLNYEIRRIRAGYRWGKVRSR